MQGSPQEPRVLWTPPHDDDSLGDDAIELAASVGLNLDPWQQFAVKAVCAQQSGKWSAFEVCLLAPRQNGKNAVIECLELAGLFLWDDRLQIHSAHLFPTAQEGFRRIHDLIRNSDELSPLVLRVSMSHGEEGIELRNGNRLRFMARSKQGSGRGFSADKLYLDESYRLPREAIAAMMPTLAARPNPQILYTSSTGLLDSEVLRDLTKRGRAGNDPTLTYLEWSADPNELDLDDRKAWKQANPALGIRLSETLIASERATMSDDDFARERLGIWADQDTIASLIDLGRWNELEDNASEADPSVIAVDVAFDRSYGSIAMAGTRHDGLTHLEVIEHKRGTGWIAQAVEALHDKYDCSVVLDAGGPAGSLLASLEALGIPVTVTSTADVAHAAASMLDAIEQGTVRHRTDYDLDNAVTSVKKRPLGDGAFAFGRKSSQADISPLVACALAHWGMPDGSLPVSIFFL